MQRIAICLLLITVLAVTAWVSMRLAGVRVYQADECQNIYSARILTTGQLKNVSSNASPFLAMRCWLTRNSTDAVDFFVRGRFLMLEIFWLNLVLIALATGENLISGRGLIALLGAFTLAPLWDYGFEIRPDNLVLTCVLLTWCTVRARPGGVQSYVIAGVLAVVMQFISVSSFVFWLPIAFLILAFPPPGHKAPRSRLALAWLLSALVTLLLIRFIYGLTGTWELYKASLHPLTSAAMNADRFSPWQSLSRLLRQTPLLLALVGAGLLALSGQVRRSEKAALTWNSSLPEAFLFAIAFIALAANPNPYPYNLLHLVSYAYLFAWRYVSVRFRDTGEWHALRPAVVAVVVFGHLVPFGLTTSRHGNWTNFRQERLMRLAEQLTDPTHDPVYDAIGMVPTRRTVGLHLDTANVYASPERPGREFNDELPAAVFISSYRTDWFPKPTHAFMQQHYVSLADDFWVLGNRIPKGGGSFEISRPGRYRICTLQGSDLAGTYQEGLKGMMAPEDKGTLSGTLDGLPLPDRPVELSVGKHLIETAASDQVAVVWVGPHLDRIHRIGPGDHRALFVNWY